MTLSFRYKTIRRPDGTEVKTPSIPVILRGKEKFETMALLDSGADISAMPKSIAEILGLDVHGKITAAYGIGGRVDAVETKVNMTVAKGYEQYDIQIPVKVLLGSYDFPLLLGRAVFFDMFVISFNQGQGKVSLKRVSRTGEPV